jgi:uncharacterized membrane protein
MTKFRRPLLYLLSAALCATGFLHLLSPDSFVAIIPAKLPSPEWLNVLAGLAEIILGVFLLEPRTRVFAAWGVIALMIAVYPANIHMAMNPDQFPDMSPTALYARLPIQFVMIAIVWWATRQVKED